MKIKLDENQMREVHGGKLRVGLVKPVTSIVSSDDNNPSGGDNNNKLWTPKEED